MEVRQVYELLNTTTKEVLGKTDLVLEDLSNVVDVGNELFSATSYDNYVKTLVDAIGRVIFVNRKYEGSVPSVLMDNWEFGAVLEKVRCEPFEATANGTWDLEDGKEYPQDTFYKPKISVKFFNKRETFEVPVSITDKQVKSAFTSAQELGSFFELIYNQVDESLSIRVDELCRMTINNFIGETLKTDEITSETASTKSTARCVNLLKLYNDKTGAKLTSAKALNDETFLRYCSKVMKMYRDRLKSVSTIFNVEGKVTHTPESMLHVVLLSEFESSVESAVMSNTYHNEYVSLPKHETVAYWQGSGLDFDYASASKINIKTVSGVSIELGGIVGVMFDRDALGVSNTHRYYTTHRNDKHEFSNFWYKYDAGWFNDFNENFVVFFIA